jgi:hypothetical protein
MAVDADVVALEACQRGLETLPPGPRRRSAGGGWSASPARRTGGAHRAADHRTQLPARARLLREAGRLLRPLAITKTLVVLAAALVALTVAPVLRGLCSRGPVRAEFDHPLTRGLVRLYRPFVGAALQRPADPGDRAPGAPLLSAAPGPPGPRVPPPGRRGDLLFMPTTLPGAPMEELPAAPPSRSGAGHRARGGDGVREAGALRHRHRPLLRSRWWRPTLRLRPGRAGRPPSRRRGGGRAGLRLLSVAPGRL